MAFNEIITTLLGILAGGSLTWIFTIKATRRKANGEAQQTEVEAWKSMQDVYQQTIEDLNKYCEDIRIDRTHLREDRDAIRALNDELQKKYQDMENELMELKSAVARQGRKIEALLPFTCAVVGCINRTKVDVNEAKLEPETTNNKNQ